MPLTHTLILMLPAIAVIALFGALSLVGLIDPSDPALQPKAEAVARRRVIRRLPRR